MKFSKISPVILSLALGSLLGATAVSKTVQKTKAEEEIVIKPFAEYLFQDAENFGKDTSGNGFDLVQKVTSSKPEAIQLLEDSDGKYLSIKHDTNEDGSAKNTGGAWLYAPMLGNTNKDLSDLIEGNYTFTTTIRAQYSTPGLTGYAINFGRYCSAPLLIPCDNGVRIYYGNTDFYDPTCGTELQPWLESVYVTVPVDPSLDNDWITFTLTADASTGKMRMFVNGTFALEVTCPNGATKLSNSKANEEASAYTFCIGGQCDTRGGSIDPIIGAVCDYREVSIYDCKLSDDNVKELYDGRSAVISKQERGNDVYVTEVKKLDTSTLDLEITDKNTVNDVIDDQLNGKQLEVTTSDGVTASYPTSWYPEANGTTIKGKAAIPGAINCNNTQEVLTYNYVCKLNVDSSKVDVSEVTLDNKDYTFGDPITSSRHTISFVLTTKAGITLDAVSYNDMDWEAEEDTELPEGSYLFMIQFSRGAEIFVDVSGETTDGPNKEEEKEEDKEETETKKGCSGSVIAGSAMIALLSILGAGFALTKKKED